MTRAPVTLADLGPLLLRRKRFLFAAGVATAVLGFCAIQIAPKTYKSEAGIAVETRPPNSQTLMPVDIDSIVATQEDVLRSRGVIEYVVQELHLAQSPALVPAPRLSPIFMQTITDVVAYLRNLTSGGAPASPDDGTEAAITYIQRHLKLMAGEHSSVVTAQFSAATPETSVSVLNAIINTYISGGVKAVSSQVEGISKWLSERADAMQAEAQAANDQVVDFVRSRNIQEIQGSSASSLEYAKNQEQLTAAQQRYSRAQTSLDLMNQFGAQVAPETLESKTIQQYRESESRLLEKMATLSSGDPRRVPLQQGVDAVHTQIAAETGKIATLIRQKAQAARMDLQLMEQIVKGDEVKARSSTGDGAVLAGLRHDAEMKQQMAMALRASANDQARIAASQVPPARTLFTARILPSHSNAPLAIVLGFICGIVGGSASIVLRRAFSVKIRDTRAIFATIGLRTAGSLPEITDAVWRKPSWSGSLIAETLRAVSLSMSQPFACSDPEQRDRCESRTILVTSSDSGEGKTTVAATLARIMAADGYRVLLIDADLRRPRLASALGGDVSNATLEAVCEGRASLRDILQQLPVFGVRCVFSKGQTSNPIGALASSNFSKFLGDARGSFDFIILDSPPVLRVADALILSKLTEHILFLVGAERVTTDLVSEAINRFSEEDRHKIRPLLTRVKARDLEKRDLYGGYLTIAS